MPSVTFNFYFVFCLLFGLWITLKVKGYEGRERVCNHSNCNGEIFYGWLIVYDITRYEELTVVFNILIIATVYCDTPNPTPFYGAHVP